MNVLNFVAFPSLTMTPLFTRGRSLNHAVCQQGTLELFGNFLWQINLWVRQLLFHQIERWKKTKIFLKHAKNSGLPRQFSSLAVNYVHFTERKVHFLHLFSADRRFRLSRFKPRPFHFVLVTRTLLVSQRTNISVKAFVQVFGVSGMSQDIG